MDDNPTNRRVLLSQLAGLGISAQCAGDGPSALGALLSAVKDRQPYQVAILDHRMPEMDGVMLARAIRSQSELDQVALVLLTSHLELEKAQTSQSAGITAYLSKPIRSRQLKAILAKVFHKALTVQLSK